MTWIKCSERLPPKNRKFLFHYHYGIGLAQWEQSYEIINGNSERQDKKYLLILWPSEINDGSSEVFQWDNKTMVDMKVSWMPLPEPPNDLD
jgi:hypothetical protein